MQGAEQTAGQVSVLFAGLDGANGREEQVSSRQDSGPGLSPALKRAALRSRKVS